MAKCQQPVSPEERCRYLCRTRLSTFPKLKVGIKNTCVRLPTRTGALKEVRAHAAERERNRSQGVELKNEGDCCEELPAEVLVLSSPLEAWAPFRNLLRAILKQKPTNYT